MERASGIDIVVPTHNRAALLRRAVESVRAQTVGDWRMIIVADACTDDTAQVVAAFDDPRIELIESAVRHGKPGGPRQLGYQATTAPYVAYLDDDDQWLPNHLATLLGLLHAGARWAATGAIYVDDDGNQRPAGGLYNTVWHPEMQLMSQMYEPSRTAHARPLVATAGGWVNVNREDWDLWLRMADEGETLAVSAESTVLMRFSMTTQRHTAPSTWFQQRLGSVPTEEAAEAVLATAATPEWRTRFAEAFYAEMREWLAGMCSSQRMSLPAGSTADDLLNEWDRMSQQAPKGHPLPLTGELQYLPEGDGYVVFAPVQAIHQTHADRIERQVGRMAPRQVSMVRKIIVDCGGTV